MDRISSDRDSCEQAGADADASGLVAAVDELFRQVVRRIGGQPLLPVDLDLTMGQFRMLWVLATEQRLSMGQLADHLGMGQPSTSRMVDRLVQDHYLERWDDPADRRRALVRLTARGRAVVEGAASERDDARARLTSLFTRLSPAEIAHLAAGLRALLSAAEQDVDPTV